MASFYARPEDICGNRIALRKDELAHVTRARRHQEGDTVEVIDGQGHRYRVRIDAIAEDGIRGTVVGCQEEPGSLCHIILAQALLKGSRFDLVVEKATELGVRRIVPLITERTIVPTASANKLGRWRRIAVEATKQSLGSFVPEIEAPQDLSEALAGLGGEAGMLVAWESETQALLHDVLPGADKRTGKICLWVGPEGGFTDAEVEQARAFGARCFSLGSKRLRAETAGIVAVALLQYECMLLSGQGGR
jgi:16S rRNA (uracil1498-N3)-methyltransferase